MTQVSRWRAFTMFELVVVIAIIGSCGLVALRQLQVQLARIATRDALATAGAIISRARDEAITQRAITSIIFDTSNASISLKSRGLTLQRASLADLFGATFTTSRDSIAFDVRGLGYGAANLTLVMRRGVSSDTLTVSRLGRVRY